MNKKVLTDKNIVHISHCCKKHGCKYGDADCPVVKGEAKQKYPCENCGSDEDIIKSLSEDAQFFYYVGKIISIADSISDEEYRKAEEFVRGQSKVSVLKAYLSNLEAMFD